MKTFELWLALFAPFNLAMALVVYAAGGSTAVLAWCAAISLVAVAAGVVVRFIRRGDEM